MAIMFYKYVAHNDLNTQLRIPSSLVAATHALEMLKNSDSKGNSNTAYSQDIKILKRKSIELAKKTLRRFPDAGRAYGQLAFVLYRTSGKKKAISRLYKRCFGLDQAASFCRDGNQAIQHKND